MNKYLTTREAAEFLGVSPSRVRQFIQQRRLKSEKHGRDHMLLREDVHRFASKGTLKRGRPPLNQKK
jgi:site-specific DNA-methyltransferase (adenine-specific)